MKKFYIASSFKNADTVKLVSQRLIDNGYIHTYDWTQNERASTMQDLKEIGQKEINGIMDADFILVLLPAGKGSHIEFGIALGQVKKIYLYSPDNGLNNLETTSTFYHLPQVNRCVGSVERLVEMVLHNK